MRLLGIGGRYFLLPPQPRTFSLLSKMEEEIPEIPSGKTIEFPLIQLWNLQDG
jgi:hypothetical protein